MTNLVSLAGGGQFGFSLPPGLGWRLFLGIYLLLPDGPAGWCVTAHGIFR